MNKIYYVCDDFGIIAEFKTIDEASIFIEELVSAGCEDVWISTE